MRLTRLILALTVLLVPPLAAGAQAASEVRRIGLLAGPSPSAGAAFAEAFRRGLRERGWVAGQNLIVELRWAEGKPERHPAHAAELVPLNVEVIVATTTQAALAAKQATRTIPIVMVLPSDPVGSGLVASLGRPGGNVTGLSSMGRGISQKQLELLTQTVPQVRRVAVLRNPASSASALALTDVETAAESLGVELEIQAARRPEEFEGAFTTMTAAGAGALLVLPDAMFFQHRTRLAQLSARYRLPTMHGLRPHVHAGDLMVYAANFADLFRRAGTVVDKILKGADPATLPVEQPTKFHLAVNLKTAKALGLTIPKSILFRATEVIR